MAWHVASELGSRFFKNHKPGLLIRLGRRRVRRVVIFLTNLLTYSMEQSPSEKLTGSQLVKKFPPFYGT